MNRWLARLKYALRRHGPIGLIWLAAYNIIYHALPRDRGPKRLPHPDAFDEKYCTDTGSIREIGSLDVVNTPAARYAVRYDPSSAEWVGAQLDKLQIEYERFGFIDFGSGKGRVLLVAASFPFREVVGIEFSRELHEIAIENIARLPAEVIRASAIRSVYGDAASFDPPPSDLVCYFYNPFGAPVIEAVASRLAAHHKQHHHRIIIIYCDPRHPEIFRNTGEFKILEETTHAIVFATHLGTAADAAVTS
jgi:16S rRNA G966 N2-methylase RsmD